METNPLPHNALSYDNYHLPGFPHLLATGAEKQMEEVINFDSRQTDIILTTYPKSGTNWVSDILYMLVTGKTEYNQLKDFNTMLEAADFEKLNEMTESPRLLATHLPFRHLPKKHMENGYKVIYVMRNPKDVSVSFYCHMKKNTITCSDTFPGSWDAFLENFMAKKFDLYGNWFAHAKEWEEAKASGRCRNVHTVTFEDLKKNPVAEIKRMSDFLGYQHSDELLEEIATRCTFENVVQATKTSAKDVTMIKNMSVDGSDYIRNKGQIGNWKQWFTVDQNERFNQIIKSEMKDSKIKMIYE